MLALGADCSTTYSRPPTQTEAELWCQLGLKLMVVGTSFRVMPPFAAGQHLNMWSRYVPVQEYMFPESLHSTPHDWWVDAETPTANQASIGHAINKGAGGIYTRRGWWNDNLPGWNIKAQYPALKLWDARYTHGDGPCLIVNALNTGNMDAIKAAIIAERDATPPFRAYGGFTKADMTQWHNSITIFGINVDLNFFEEGERMYTDEEIDAKIGACLTAIGANGAKTDELANATNAVIGHNDVLNNDPKLSLKGLYYIAGKLWPFGDPKP